MEKNESRLKHDQSNKNDENNIWTCNLVYLTILLSSTSNMKLKPSLNLKAKILIDHVCTLVTLRWFDWKKIYKL
jgi:hypothetical protein